jgi:hypothetical protein
MLCEQAQTPFIMDKLIGNNGGQSIAYGLEFGVGDPPFYILPAKVGSLSQS